MPNNDYLMDEKQIPENWVDSPRQAGPRVAPAPPAPNPMPGLFDGSLAPQIQQNVNYVGTTQASPQVPKYSLMPQGIQGSPSTNAAIASTAAKTPSPVTANGTVGLNVPAELTPTTQTITIPGTLAVAWAPEAAGTVFSGPVPANLNINQVDYEVTGALPTNTVSLLSTANNPDFSMLLFTGNGTSSTPAGWTQSPSPPFYYQQTPAGSVSVTCSQTGGPTNETIAAMAVGFNAPGITVTPAEIATTGGSWGSAGISMNTTFTAANKVVLAFVTASGSTDGSGTSSTITDAAGNTWNFVNGVFNSYSAIVGGVTHYFMSTVNAWVCVNPVVGTYNVTTTPNTNAGESITGAVFSIFDITGIQAIEGIPSFKPINEFLAETTAVQSLNALTGAVSLVGGAGIGVTPNGNNLDISNTGVIALNSETGSVSIIAGSGIGVTTGAGTITIASTGGSAGSTSLFSFPPCSLYNVGGSTYGYTAAPINGTANNISMWYFNLDVNVTFQKIYFIGGGTDVTNMYDVGIYTVGGALQANIGATSLSLGGFNGYATLQGTVTLAPGPYFFAITSNGAGTFKFGISYDIYASPICLCNGSPGAPAWMGTTTASSGAVLPSSMTPVFSGVSILYVSNPPAQPVFALANY